MKKGVRWRVRVGSWSVVSWGIVAMGALAGALAWLVLQRSWGPSAEQPGVGGGSSGSREPWDQSQRSRQAATKRASALRRERGRGPRSSQAASPSSQPADCEPYVATGCYGRNVHWFDSCGTVLDLQEDCGEGFCARGACVAPDWFARCAFPPEGRCKGQVLQLCDRGDDLQLDCTQRNQECRQGAEGAGCFDVESRPRCEPGPAFCDGNTLVRCVEGYREETECSWQSARCMERGGELGASCASPPPAEPDLDLACGPCGCPRVSNGSAERCDGVDDDANGFIDDGAPCDPIPIDVWVGSGAQGGSLTDELALAQEIEQTNQIFRGSHSQIQFELGSVSRLEELGGPEGEDITFEQLLQLLEAPNPHGVSGELRVRLVFAGRLLEGETPRLGVAFPFVTHGCGQIREPGGIRHDRALVAIALARTPTTLAHELGHWLGLCHTHDARGVPTAAAVVDPVQGAVMCGDECVHGGDAICDTPPDSDACAYDPETCAVSCPDGEQPDPSNVMSYYHACRELFSSDQVQMMEHTLALRKQWAQCRDKACVCEPGAFQCPRGMSCRPLGPEATSFACGMDGARRLGQSCRGLGDCSDQTLCLGSEQASVCVRPCRESLPGCTCVPLTGTRLSLCREDLSAVSAGAPPH